MFFHQISLPSFWLLTPSQNNTIIPAIVHMERPDSLSVPYLVFEKNGLILLQITFSFPFAVLLL